MAVTVVSAVVRMPFSQREGYGGPYPDGLAFGFVPLEGDLSGGTVTAFLTSPAGFLYRVEEVQAERSDTGVGNSTNTLLLTATWLEATSGDPPPASDFVYGLINAAILGGEVYRDAIQSGMRRVPVGVLSGVGEINMVRYSDAVNTDGVTYGLRMLFSYWRKESLYLPGFLSSFYATPVVPEP